MKSSSLTSQMETLLNENDKLIKIIEEKNEEIRRLKANTTNNNSVNQSLIESGAQSTKDKDKEILNLQQQLNDEKEQFKNFKTKILMVIEENEKLQQMYEQLSNDYTQLEMGMKNSNMGGNSQFIQLQEENKELKKKLEAGGSQSQ